MTRSPRRRALALVALGVVAISFAAIFFRETAPTHPLVAAGGRLVLAALLLAPWTLRGWRRMSPKVRRGALLGGVFYALHFGTWVSSLSLTSVAASVTLVTATPLLLALFAFATGRDRPSRRQWFAIALGLLGVLAIAHEAPSEGALLGDLLAFAGAAAMAGYLLVVRSLGRIDPFAFTGVACAVGGALLLGAAPLAGVAITIPTWEAAAFVALAALVPQLIGHTSLTFALRHVTPTTIGLATVFEPVGSTLLGWVWLREVPGAWTLGGCAIVLVAVALSFSGPRSG